MQNLRSFIHERQITTLSFTR